MILKQFILVTLVSSAPTTVGHQETKALHRKPLNGEGINVSFAWVKWIC